MSVTSDHIRVCHSVISRSAEPLMRATSVSNVHTAIPVYAVFSYATPACLFKCSLLPGGLLVGSLPDAKLDALGARTLAAGAPYARSGKILNAVRRY